MVSALAFIGTFQFLDSGNWIERTFGPELIMGKTSHLQNMVGEVYGICAPMEKLRELNLQIAPILS